MNIETGEIAELDESVKKLIEAKGTEEIPKGVFPEADKLGPVNKKDVATIGVGDTVDVKGCPCKIVHINPGKKRITLQAIGKMKLESKNPSWMAKSKSDG